MTKRTLTQLRHDRGWRLADVAVRMDCDPVTVYRWESGQRQPTAANLLRLSDLHMVDPRSIALPERHTVDAAAHDEPSPQPVASTATGPGTPPHDSPRRPASPGNDDS
jgi:transcriptional regulator with XRE-family HTH domain